MRIVIALGGNALGNDVDSQKKNVSLFTKSILNIIKDGNEVIFTHGNGPQVGLINLAFDDAKKINPKVCPMPFPECGAMSQGYIGYHLQNALLNEFKENNIDKKVVSLITQVLVDKNDPAFKNPTKPIGSFYKKEEIVNMEGKFAIDASRGYRKVVASPKPIEIIEKDQIDLLLKNNFIVIACGGGGIPLINDNNKLIGVDAVIDKDLCSAKLATDLKADVLMILTAVDSVKLNYNKENEISLNVVSCDEIKQYYNEGHFYEGSMKPKVEACLNFVSDNKIAIISDIENAYEALKYRSKGTIIKGN